MFHRIVMFSGLHIQLTYPHVILLFGGALGTQFILLGPKQLRTSNKGRTQQFQKKWWCKFWETFKHKCL